MHKPITSLKIIVRSFFRFQKFCSKLYFAANIYLLHSAFVISRNSFGVLENILFDKIKKTKHAFKF